MILDDIVARKRIQLQEEGKAVSISALEMQAVDAPPVRDFHAALSGNGLSVIAEVKRASPSKGMISEDFDYLGIARQYESGGAAAVSVLTEKHFFKGDNRYLTEIRQKISLPVLRKDFIISERQVIEARAIGADAILLIAAILDDAAMKQLYKLAGELGLHCLFEAHDEREIGRVANCGAKIIGVNNRNLHIFEVSLSTFERLRGLIPESALTVAESGIHTPKDASRMKSTGADAILVGESLMKAGDGAAMIRKLAGGAG